MNWNVNPSPDVDAYIVYQFNGAVWVPIDTVYGINNTNYTYLLSNAYLASEQYRFILLLLQPDRLHCWIVFLYTDKLLIHM